MTRALDGTSVLIVEDDEDSRELLEMILQNEGATVRGAGFLAEVGALLDASLPDVVVTDMTLPDGDGFAVLAAVTARSDVPTIALTGRAEDDARERANAAGFAKYLTKPVDAFMLVTAVASLTRLRQVRAESNADADGPPLHANMNMRALLARLNAATGYRYTSILRFSEGKLDSVWTFDRAHPTTDAFPPDVYVEDSYCTDVARTQAAFVVTDALVDARVDGHPKRGVLRAYCGVPLRYADGTLFGSLCHYDEEPRALDPSAVAEMEKVAATLAAILPPAPLRSP